MIRFGIYLSLELKDDFYTRAVAWLEHVIWTRQVSWVRRPLQDVQLGNKTDFGSLYDVILAVSQFHHGSELNIKKW